MNGINTLQLNAIKKIAAELNKIIESLEHDNSHKSPVIWTGNASDLVELAYGIIETKRFNQGDVDVKVAVQYLCEVFSFEVKDCYDTYRAIRRRVDSRTLLLDEMKERLNERMDKTDEGIFKKRRR